MGARWSNLGKARPGGSGASLLQLSLLDWRSRRTKAQAGWRHWAFNCRGVVEVKLANWSSLRPMWSSHRLGNW